MGKSIMGLWIFGQCDLLTYYNKVIINIYYNY